MAMKLEDIVVDIIEYQYIINHGQNNKYSYSEGNSGNIQKYL